MLTYAHLQLHLSTCRASRLPFSWKNIIRLVINYYYHKLSKTQYYLGVKSISDYRLSALEYLHVYCIFKLKLNKFLKMKNR